MEKRIKLIRRYGGDILISPGMRLSRVHLQHGCVSVFEHSLRVTLLCLCLSEALRLRVNQRALVRGALLHDYFLYDWHVPDPSHRWHGLHHHATALKNARRDFGVSPTEANMIEAHMFPLVLRLPRCRESVLLCVADKLCAFDELMQGRKARPGAFARRRAQNTATLNIDSAGGQK